MRADRLVAVLLFLQSRGRATVAEVAAELEVSERTARRDLEALALSGVPVYPQRGRGGGWALVGGARTDLSGLTADEIRTLFLLTGPAATTPELRTLLRKLVRALPGPLRAGADSAAQAAVADPLDWSRGETAPAHGEEVRRAVVAGLQLRLGYASPGRPPSERSVHPLGLASKAGAEYLVAGTGSGLQVFRLDRITSAVPSGEPVARPEGFDLATAWRELAARIEDRMRTATVAVRAEPGAERLLSGLFGSRLRVAGRDEDGTLALEVDGPSAEVVAAQLAGLGARVEVVSPPEARAQLARIGRELTERYGGSAG